MRVAMSRRQVFFSGLLIFLVGGALFIALRIGRGPVSPPEIPGEKGPKIIEVFPENGAQDVPVGSALEVSFDSSVNEDFVNYSITPPVELAKTVDPRLPVIYLSPIPLFEPGREYFVTITAGDSSYSFSFKTSEEITADEEAALQSSYDTEFNEAADEYERTHPLLELMPVEEVLFRIEYKGNGLYEYSLKGTDKNRARELMLSWWRGHGVNPDELNLKEKGK
jgi:hypothetical protein